MFARVVYAFCSVCASDCVWVCAFFGIPLLYTVHSPAWTINGMCGEWICVCSIHILDPQCTRRAHYLWINLISRPVTNNVATWPRTRVTFFTTPTVCPHIFALFCRPRMFRVQRGWIVIIYTVKWSFIRTGGVRAFICWTPLEMSVCCCVLREGGLVKPHKQMYRHHMWAQFLAMKPERERER